MSNMEDKWEAQFQSGENERDELMEIIRWSYSKLHLYHFGKVEDILRLNRMKLLLEHDI